VEVAVIVVVVAVIVVVVIVITVVVVVAVVVIVVVVLVVIVVDVFLGTTVCFSWYQVPQYVAIMYYYLVPGTVDDEDTE